MSSGNTIRKKREVICSIVEIQMVPLKYFVHASDGKCLVGWKEGNKLILSRLVLFLDVACHVYWLPLGNNLQKIYGFIRLQEPIVITEKA